MNSSTSSSDPGERAAPRGPYVRILVAVVLGLAAAQGVLLVMLALNDASAESIISRVSEARSYLPAIVAEEGDLVMAFGSSMTQAAFGARQFDRAMAERGVDVTSFNFGFGGLNPYFQDYLSRRIRDAFVEQDRRLKLAVIEFTPLQNTQARWNGAQPAVDSYVAMLADGGDLFDLILDDPTRGIRTAEIKYLRNEVSAEITTWYFGDLIFGTQGRPEVDVPEDEAKEAILEELGPILNERFEQDYPDYDDCNWCWDWQGAGTILEERSEETLALFERFYDALRSERRLESDRQWRIASADIEELRFEEELVAAFIRIVRNFQEFSDHVEVILMPRNHAWIRRGPEAWERLRTVLARIERETGVTIRSFEDAPEITPDMFSDTTHLSRYAGDVAYTNLLVETYAPVLGAAHPIPSAGPGSGGGVGPNGK